MTKQDRHTNQDGDTERNGGRDFARYADFWPFYLRQHSKPGTRRAHFAGTALVLMTAAASILTGTWLLLLALPVIGYGFAWAGHFLIEGNKPATFGHPIWSLYSDFRMFFLWCSGKLEGELISAGILDRLFQNKDEY